MNNQKYTIEFVTGIIITVWASSHEEAKILAQAEMIRKGMRYEVK